MSSSPIHNHLVTAWKLTSNAGKIRRFNFVGSIIDTLILSGTLIYQIGYVWLDVMQKKSEFFTWLREFATSLLGSHGVTFVSSLAVVGVFYFLVNFLIKNIFNAGLIYLIRAYTKQSEREYHTMPAFTFGWKKSIKLAEYHSLLFWSKPVYIFYIFFWGYRLLHGDWGIIFAIAGVYVCALLVTRFFFEYARYFIIVNDSGVFESLGLSLTMTLENITVTLRIFVSLLLVYMREIILLAGIFALPFLISWLVALGLGPIFLQGVLVLIALVYLAFLIIVSAMNSVIEIFVETLWYSVFTNNLSGDAHAPHAEHHAPATNHHHGHAHH